MPLKRGIAFQQPAVIQRLECHRIQSIFVYTESQWLFVRNFIIFAWFYPAVISSKRSESRNLSKHVL